MTNPETQTNGATENHTPPPPPPTRSADGAKAHKPKKPGKTKSKKERAVKAKSKITKKTKIKKPAKTKAVAVASQAQSGPAIELPIEKMNKDEIKLLKALWSKSGERKAKSIKELQAVLGGGKDTSPARNALRRPVRGGWIEKAERGKYRLTEKGRKRGFKEA